MAITPRLQPLGTDPARNALVMAGFQAVGEGVGIKFDVQLLILII
jgi:hypothetical protein